MRLLLIALFITPTTVFAGLCVPTEHMSTGTHYKPISRKQINVGRGLFVRGKILSARNCKPIVGAKIAHWQGNKNGVYDDRLRAYLFSGSDGAYAFHTEWPAMAVPHIHFNVSAKGHRSLSTQWVGDKKLKKLVFDIVLLPK